MPASTITDYFHPITGRVFCLSPDKKKIKKQHIKTNRIDKNNERHNIRQYFIGLPKRVTVKKALADSDMEAMEGDHIDASHYSHVVDYDCDVFTDSGKLLFKFRKHAFDILSRCSDSREAFF